MRDDLDTIKSRVEAEISSLVLHQPIYGNIFLPIKRVWTDKVKSMGVGPLERVRVGLFINPDFVRKINNMELRAVLIHEALHILLDHLFRMEVAGYEDGQAWNVAADLAINPFIPGLPQNALFPSQFKLPDKQTADFYYEKLEGQIPPDTNSMDDHDLWDEEHSSVVKERVQDIAKEAIQAQEDHPSGFGNLPGNLVGWIKAAQKPKVNWKMVFRYFIHQTVQYGQERTWARPNRRYLWYSPGVKSDFTSRLLVAIDVSASITDEDLQEFVDEISGMKDVAEFDYVQFDTELKGEPEPWTSNKFKVRGRGGTVFGPVMEAADKGGYDGLVMLTDGNAAIPTAPRTRVLWALPKKYKLNKFPYGMRVVIE